MQKSFKKHNRIRLAIQVASTAIVNGYAAGFIHGKIFTGETKALCVPVLNCYSCPGALGACPIGALQAVLGGNKHSVSFYVLGFLMLFGIILGRLMCGFLCPFGLVQDLLYKIHTRKFTVPARIDRILRPIKYIMLIGLVIAAPLIFTNTYGIAEPYFCKLICPAGVLQGALPLMSINEGLRAAAGLLFSWKFALLCIVIITSIVISRPFCKYVCPLGAFYGLFNKFSLYQMSCNKSTCIQCGTCKSVCLMDIDITEYANSTECVRCGRCKASCPTHSITAGFITPLTPIKTQQEATSDTDQI